MRKSINIVQYPSNAGLIRVEDPIWIDVLAKYTSDFAMETSTVVDRVFLKRIILLSFGACLSQRKFIFALQRWQREKINCNSQHFIDYNWRQWRRLVFWVGYTRTAFAVFAKLLHYFNNSKIRQHFRKRCRINKKWIFVSIFLKAPNSGKELKRTFLSPYMTMLQPDLEDIKTRFFGR